MANARKVKRNEDDEKREIALKEYTENASQLPKVVCVALVPGPERDLFVYIDDRDLDVIDRLFDFEDVLYEQLGDDMFDVHIRYLEGRPIEQSRPSSVRVVYQRA
jgi:hypothetical protein